jgi:hypothetical protein
MRSRKHHLYCLDLIPSYFADNIGIFYPVLCRFCAIGYPLKKFYQFPIQMSAFLIRILEWIVRSI